MGTEVITVKEGDSAESPSALEQKIIRQIEYYFGNYNLSRDKFLKEEIKRDDGWVPLETMVKFNRLKSLSEDFVAISEALKKSPNQLMEVNDDCTKIRRKVPVPESNLYVKGFKRDSQLDEILDFFKDYKVENVQMRRRYQGNKSFFRGSVFATFLTKEDADAFLEMKGIKYGKTEMIKERKKDYVKRKDEFFDNLRAEKAKKEAERKAAGEEELDKSKGCLLKLSGLSEDTKRDELREAGEKFGKVAFVDYFNGKPEAIIRFDKGIVSDIIKEATEEDGEKKLEIGSIKANISIIEGEEEQQYWKVITDKKEQSSRRGNMKFGNKGRFNKKNRGYQRNQKRNREDDEQSNKLAKGDNSSDATKAEEVGEKSDREKTKHDDEQCNKHEKVDSCEVKEVSEKIDGKKTKSEAQENEPPSKRPKVEAGSNISSDSQDTKSEAME